MASFTAFRRFAALALLASLVGSGAPHARLDWTRALDGDERGLVGFAGRGRDSSKPKLTAFFPRQSYRAGDTATLEIRDTPRHVRVQIFRAGTFVQRILPSDVITGSPSSDKLAVGAVSGTTRVSLRIGDWPSGFYYARLTSGDRIGYATFVLRPRTLGEHEVAVVLPTQTWQAYNFRDDNGDGVPDTWYVHGRHARLVRPFLNRGVPPHYKFYDAPFLAWAYASHHDVDYLSDADLNGSSGDALRAAYRLILFEGHHEYVTDHEYDAVARYRDLGGHLMFLSANNFFWKVTIASGVMTRVAKWRDLGRPEASLLGVEYYRNDRGSHRGPWLVRAAARRFPWLLDGTGLGVGSSFGIGGIEADDVTPDSPRGTTVLAAIPNLYGDGRDADMTYYETSSGAKVFAAGAFSLASWMTHTVVARLVANVWEHLATG